jgi:hypothetical protein
MKVYIEDIFGEKLEIDVTALDSCDVTDYLQKRKYRGHFIGFTLDVIDIQRYDATHMELRDGRKMHFSLTLKVSDSVDFLIDYEDIRRFYVLQDLYREYGTKTTSISLAVDALTSGRMTPKQIEELIESVKRKRKSNQK